MTDALDAPCMICGEFGGQHDPDCMVIDWVEQAYADEVAERVYEEHVAKQEDQR